MLELEDVSHVYANGTRALDHVTLSIPRGMYGLLGPNGAGKSTLMRTVATLQTPTEGQVKFGDIDIIAEPEKLRRTLGYLPQDFGVYPRVSAYDMLDHMAVLKGIAGRSERKATVDSLLNQTNLWPVRDKALAGFSGGMRQRFGIAQALLGDPQLIIVDEPTAGLDPQERVRFHNLLSDIGQDKTVLLSTHIVSDVADLCSNMAIINKGHVLLCGEPQKLIEEISDKIWERFVPKAAVAMFQKQHAVISTRLLTGRTLIRVYAERDPGDEFLPAIGDLEDVYFATIAGRHTAASNC
ncbi:MAG: ABC transporter ATP-binding protein [Telluria sp.]